MERIVGKIELSLRGHIRHQTGGGKEAHRYGNLEYISTYMNHTNV